MEEKIYRLVRCPDGPEVVFARAEPVLLESCVSHPDSKAPKMVLLTVVFPTVKPCQEADLGDDNAGDNPEKRYARLRGHLKLEPERPGRSDVEL